MMYEWGKNVDFVINNNSYHLLCPSVGAPHRLGFLPILPHLLFTTLCWRRYCYLHFAHKKTGARLKWIAQGHTVVKGRREFFSTHIWVLNQGFSNVLSFRWIIQNLCQFGSQHPRWSQCPQLPGRKLHTLAESHPALDQGWSLRSITYGRGGGVPLLRLSYKSLCFPLGPSSLVFHSTGSKRQLNNPMKRPTGEGLKSLANSQWVTKVYHQPPERV